jgi:type III restriction enzyme
MQLGDNQWENRIDDPATLHDLNVLTVVAVEDLRGWSMGIHREIAEAISGRSRRADLDYFTGKILLTDAGAVEVTPAMAREITRNLIWND